MGNRAAQAQEGEKIDCLLKAEIWSQLQMGWIKEMWSPPRRWWIHCDEHHWMPLSSLFSPPGRVLILSWGSLSYVLWVTSGEVIILLFFSVTGFGHGYITHPDPPLIFEGTLSCWRVAPETSAIMDNCERRHWWCPEGDRAEKLMAMTTWALGDHVPLRA